MKQLLGVLFLAGILCGTVFAGGRNDNAEVEKNGNDTFPVGLAIGKMEDNVYFFEETGARVDAYLIIGEKRAVMIDTLQNLQGLYAAARMITSLPIDVVINHGHVDHCGKSTMEFKDAGCTIYMDQRDEAVIKEMGFAEYPEGFFTDLRTVKEFDLGGTVLEVISLPGHTPGSAMLLDRARQRLYSSDSLGSGLIWLQMTHSLPLHEYAAILRTVYMDLSTMPDLAINPGHRSQSTMPMRLSYVADLLEAAELISAGNAVGAPRTINRRDFQSYLQLEHKSVRLAYNADNL
jgi:glyoxylase-like metal-dependent hydrolase (beta-lactamase superfamily II)